MILDKIVEHKKEILAKQKQFLPLDQFVDDLSKSKSNFKQSLKQGRGINLIAEVKRKSPSRGMINKELSYTSVIDIYDQNPLVNAVSFLTDEKYFGGSLEKLEQVRDRTNKPILRKDFIIDPYQVYQARYFGADAILLIARLLSEDQISNFIEIANEFDMDALVEVHDKNDLRNIPDEAEIIGVNNRNLDNMEISLQTTQSLAPQIRNQAEVIVTESGILNRTDLQEVENQADAVLIGSAIMADNDPGRKIDSLFCPKIKICGITRLEDALFAAENGVDFLGFIFYEGSDRYINPAEAKKIIEKVKNHAPEITFVGVFVNQSVQKVEDIAETCELNMVQLHGDESPNYCDQLDIKTSKAIQVKKNMDLVLQVNKYDTDYILLDTFHPDKYGGTGDTFDWNILDQISGKKIFLAGGISPENFEEALSYQIFAIDINSGVEKFPGKKDKDEMEKILRIKYE